MSTTREDKIFWVKTCVSVEVRAKADELITREAAATRAECLRRFIYKTK
jgi:hypothetical protein